MPDADNFLKNTDWFREKMAQREDYMSMHLPRIFANKADELFGPLLFPSRKKEEESEQEGR